MADLCSITNRHHYRHLYNHLLVTPMSKIYPKEGKEEAQEAGEGEKEEG